MEKISEAAKSIYTYCRARTNSREEAEDLSQDILVELLKSQNNLRDDKAFYGFMWAVAGNVYKNWCKKRAKATTHRLDKNIPDSNIPLPELLEKESDINLLHRELALLTEQYRQVVVLYYFDEKKVNEISKMLKITESMVKFLLFKSRKILKEGLKMERTFGNLSFNPGCLKLAVTGDNWHHLIDPTVFERNLIGQNILLACNYEQCTAEEISLQMGVAVPYLEKYLKELCEVGVLAQKGKYYETAIVIFTREFIAEEHAKTLKIQQEAAEIITQFLDEKLDDIKAIGFHTGSVDDGLLRWRITQLIIENAVLEKHKNDSQQRKDGLVWGDEDTRYGCLNVHYTNPQGDTIKFLEFFARSFNERIFDFGYFWKQEKRVNLILEIAREKRVNEADMVEVAEFIKNGWVKKDGDTLQLCIPVFTAKQFEQVLSLTDVVTNKIAEKTHEMLNISTDILMQHVSASKKKEAKTLGYLRRHYIAMCGPVEIMMGSGALRRFSDNEHPTAYVVVPQLF